MVAIPVVSQCERACFGARGKEVISGASRDTSALSGIAGADNDLAKTKRIIPTIVVVLIHGIKNERPRLLGRDLQPEKRCLTELASSDPAVSLELLQIAGLCAETSVIDVGAGTSRLVDCLIARGIAKVTLLDMSQSALDATRSRLGKAGDRVTWIIGDVTLWWVVSGFQSVR